MTTPEPESANSRPAQANPQAEIPLSGPVFSRGIVRGHVVAAVEILRGSLAEPWSLNELAEQVHLSRSQLVRAFDATLGISPMAYLRRLRVERMARVLVSTDLSIAEVALTVGWTDGCYASRCFHAAYGVSPTRFRRQHTAPPSS